MTRRVYHVAVDRVVISGAGADRIDASELHGLVERAVARELARGALPPDTTMRAAVRVVDRSVGTSGAASVAAAIGTHVARAVGGRSHG